MLGCSLAPCFVLVGCSCGLCLPCLCFCFVSSPAARLGASFEGLLHDLPNHELHLPVLPDVDLSTSVLGLVESTAGPFAPRPLPCRPLDAWEIRFLQGSLFALAQILSAKRERREDKN